MSEMSETQKCSVGNCTRIYRAKGYCVMHYERARLGRPLTEPVRLRNGDVMARFWSKVDIGNHDDCWNWTAAILRSGYGSFRGADGTKVAHRVAYESTRGKIPEGLVLDHMCHNRRCVNPSHLRTLTRGQNIQNRKSATSASKTGFRGVHWNTRDSLYTAEAKLYGVKYVIGYFKDIQDAKSAVTAWRRENMPYSIEPGVAA